MIPIILLVGLVVRLLNLNQSFWLDEAAQVIESARPLSEQFNIPADFWPPLYHLLLHSWMYFGASEIWVRLLSIIFAVITIVFVYSLTKELLSEKKAVLTTLLFATSPFHVWYSQEARPYALMTLLGIASTYYMLRRQTIAYFLSSTLFLFSTYLAPFLLITQGIYLWKFHQYRLQNWVKSIVVSMILFVPWLPSLLEQFNIGRGLTIKLPGWGEAVSTPLNRSLPLVFTKFFLGRITFDDKFVYAGLVVSLFLFVSFLGYKSYLMNRSITLKITLLGGLPILLTFLVSIFIPILAPQRVLFSLPFIYILIAMGATTLKKYSWLPVTVLLVVNLHSLYLYNTNPRFQREKWRQAVTFVEETSVPEAVVIFSFPEAFAPWQWYNQKQIRSVNVAPQFVVDPQDLIGFQSDIIIARKLYYFHYLTGLTDPQKLVPQFIENLGFTAVSTRDFPGVGFITIYEKTMAFH